MTYIDTHAHLDDEQFYGDLGAVIARAEEAGVRTVVCPGITADSSERVVKLAGRYPAIYAAVGIHPNSAGTATPNDWDRVVALTGRPRVVAVGETGLDRYWNDTPFDVQQDSFERHLALAAQCDLPVIVHCRDAEAAVTTMLRGTVAAHGGTPLRGVIHAFSGNAEFAEACLALGLSISFAGQVTYQNKKFATLHEVSKSIPDDRILIETDSPYLVPYPLRGKQKRNEPAQVVRTAAALAELRGTTVEALAALTAANARRLFRLP